MVATVPFPPHATAVTYLLSTGGLLLCRTLSRRALHAPRSAAVWMRLMLVTVRSSPTVCTFSPTFELKSIHPFQSS